MSEKPINDDNSQAESTEPVDELRAKFLAALNKKQGQQKGAVNGRSEGKSGPAPKSEGHTQRMFQRKSGSS
ncbi:MAG TPA: DUF5302 domain-containing protein [Candidatus Nanopelagicaceae bacterium]|nr:DUF5302 domain-containing protein [Candidatus Nanopelagicaceae bacterium]